MGLVRITCSVTDFQRERKVSLVTQTLDISYNTLNIQRERKAGFCIAAINNSINFKGSDKNRIARLNYAYHYITSVIAAENCDVTITRPPLRAASKSGKGNKYEHGALVDFKAKQHRKLLDLNIGKFCELLAYKVETWGNKLTVIEDTDNLAVLPGEIASLAKLSKKKSNMWVKKII